MVTALTSKVQDDSKSVKSENVRTNLATPTSANPATTSGATDEGSFYDFMLKQASEGFVSRMERSPARPASDVATLPRVVSHRNPSKSPRETGNGQSNGESNALKHGASDELSKSVGPSLYSSSKSFVSFQESVITHAYEKSLNQTQTDVRLDQDWEQSYTPPNYTWKMRRKRESEIFRQRALLVDYNKMDLYLDSEYTQFQVAYVCWFQPSTPHVTFVMNFPFGYEICSSDMHI
jgi:hypothetical protein